MLAEQFHAAADGARTIAQLDEIACLTWRAYGEAHLSDEVAQAVTEAVEARRACLKSSEALAATEAAHGPP